MDSLFIYEYVILQTKLISKAAESDLKRAQIIRGVVQKQLNAISHDLRIDLIDCLDKRLSKMYNSEADGETLSISVNELGRLSRIASYLNGVFELHRIGRAGFAKLSCQIKQNIKDSAQNIEMRWFIKEADCLVQAAGESSPKCLFQDCPDEVYIKGVRDWLFIAFFNLIHNARKHFHATSRTLENSPIIISLIQRKKNIVISISDSSGGIAPEIKHRIFDYNFSYGKEKGSGIGLWLAKEIIVAHGGEITHHAIIDGAKFEIYLPIKKLGKEK